MVRIEGATVRIEVIRCLAAKQGQLLISRITGQLGSSTHFSRECVNRDLANRRSMLASHQRYRPLIEGRLAKVRARSLGL
jgi:hypothetical protein